MPIHYFKVLQEVLSQTRDVICKVYSLGKDDAFVRAEEFIKENSGKWRLTDPAIRYGDPFCRIAYIYMNVAVHATLVHRALSSFPEFAILFRNAIESGNELKVCALGGGTGSELLGAVRFIEELGVRKTAYLDFTLVDRVREWDESWHALKSGVDEQLRLSYGADRAIWPAIISRSFLPLDVTSIEDFQDFAIRFNGINLFICCYLVSELKEFASAFEEVLNLLIARASPGALLLFVDRNETHVREAVQRIVERNSILETIGVTQERGRLGDDLHDLGEWYINIPSLPRQSWLSFSILAKKVDKPQIAEPTHVS